MLVFTCIMPKTHIKPYDAPVNHFRSTSLNYNKNPIVDLKIEARKEGE